MIIKFCVVFCVDPLLCSLCYSYVLQVLPSFVLFFVLIFRFAVCVIPMHCKFYQFVMLLLVLLICCIIFIAIGVISLSHCFYCCWFVALFVLLLVHHIVLVITSLLHCWFVVLLLLLLVDHVAFVVISSSHCFYCY